jgi:translation initiation factor IF-3
MPNRPKDGTRVNDDIRIPQIRLIGADGEQVGIIDTFKAKMMAREANLDLVEVSPTAKPPVCRIMDYGKFRFEQSKKAKQSKAKQHQVKLKEIKLHPKTALNDYQYRIKQAREFLEDGLKVKIILQFRGREMAHLDYGKRLMDQAKIDLEGAGNLEMDARMEGNTMTSIYNPLPNKQPHDRANNNPTNKSNNNSNTNKSATEPKAAGEDATQATEDSQAQAPVSSAAAS